MLEVVLHKLVLFAVNTGTKLLGERIKKINADLEKKSEIGGKLKHLNDKGLRADVIKNIAAADVRLCVAEPHVVALLADHVRVIQTWSQEVKFRDLRGAKRLITSYVELDTYLMPKEMHYDASERQQKRRLIESLVSTSSHNIVLGVPGAGKTTSMKKLCSLYTNVDSSSLPRSIPILIRFRSLPAGDSDNPLRDEIIKLIPFSCPSAVR